MFFIITKVVLVLFPEYCLQPVSAAVQQFQLSPPPVSHFLLALSSSAAYPSSPLAAPAPLCPQSPQKGSHCSSSGDMDDWWWTRLREEDWSTWEVPSRLLKRLTSFMFDSVQTSMEILPDLYGDYGGGEEYQLKGQWRDCYQDSSSLWNTRRNIQLSQDKGFLIRGFSVILERKGI